MQVELTEEEISEIASYLHTDFMIDYPWLPKLINKLLLDRYERGKEEWYKNAHKIYITKIQLLTNKTNE